MKIELHDVSKGRDGESLPAISFDYETGRATFVRAETMQRPTVLGLIASGRMRPDSGSIRIDGEADDAGIRRRVALVDAPDISEPASRVTVAGVTAEELMFAGRSAGHRAVRAWLRDQSLAHIARLPIVNVAPRDRIQLLTELALLRPGVEGLVLVAPDRHGGPPLQWWRQGQAIAERGFAMLMIAGDASATVIEAATADPGRAA